MAALKAWREVAVPHTDIRQGKFDASVFAADLGEVLAGRGAVDYRDATTFFSKTYLTGGLSELLIDMMQRLSGKRKGEPVIQLQTPFGGGKTHTLLTLYHLLKHPKEAAKLSQIQALLSKAGIREVPASSVACLVGTALGTTGGRTFWGEMAYQLDGGKEGNLYKLIAENDQRKIAPGTDLLGRMLNEAGPSMILLDEILVYLIKAAGVPVGESTLKANTLTFLQELSIAVSNCPHACMVVTLTSQIAEFFDEGAEVVHQSLEKVMGRVEKVKQTVEGQEIFEVIRRRLFEDVGGEAEHRAVAEAYWQMYQKLGEDVPSHCREPGYRDAMIAAYPFHPELISVLYERWGSITTFQRTRGVLKLLADCISDLYQSKNNDPLIQSGSINVGASAVRGELVKHTGHGNVFLSVIDSDISGKSAKAPEIDRQLGSEYAKECVAEKIARACFLYSFSGSQQKGATLPQLKLAVLNPEMAPPFVSDALDRMTKRLWYLYQESGLYRFESRPNLNRILVEREEMVRSEPDKVQDFAKSILNDLIGDAAFRVYRYPEEDRDVGDEARLCLVVLDLHQCASEDGLPNDTERLVTGILKNKGKEFRKHSNMLVFLAPDEQRSSEVSDAARRLLALRNIDEDKSTKRQLTEEQLKDLSSRLKEADARLPSALATAYRHVIVPAEKKTLRCFDMGILGSPGRTTLSSRVLEYLTAEGQIVDSLDPKIMIEHFGLWPDDQEMLKVTTLAEYFTQLTHLPRLSGPHVLPDCLAKGVGRGLFGYALGSGEAKDFDTIYAPGDKSLTADDCEIIESAWLLRPELARSLMPEPEPAVTTAGGEPVGPATVTGGERITTAEDDEEWSGEATIVEGERRLDKVRVAIQHLPWENWHDVYNEVVQPLANEGADLYCQVIIIAKGESTIRENTVELGIKESLSQRGIEADIQTG